MSNSEVKPIHRMFMKTRCVLALLLPLWSVNVLAVWTHVPTDLEASVGSSAVQAFLLDSSKRAWIGTQGGLTLFDDISGADVVSSRQPPWRHDIVGVVETADGSILTLTHSNGLYINRSDSRKFSRLHLPGDFDVRQARALTKDTLDNVWIASSEGVLGFYAAALGETISVDVFSRTPVTTTSNLVSLDNAKICFGSKRVIACIDALSPRDSEAYVVFDLETTKCTGEVTSLTTGNRNGTLLAGTSNGNLFTVRTDGAGIPTCTSPSELNSLRVTSILPLEDGYMVSTDSGVFTFNSFLTHTARANNTAQGSFYSLVASEKNVWALGETGIKLIISSDFESWPNERREQKTDITAFTGTSDGDLFIGGYERLYFYDVESKQHELIELPGTTSGKHGMKIMSLAVEGKRLLVGTFENGLHIYDRSETQSIEHHESFLENTGITVLTPFLNGLLIGTFANGLHFLSNGKISRVKLPLTSRSVRSPITSITPDGRTGKLAVVTTEDAVYRVCSEKIPHICGDTEFGETMRDTRFLSSAIDNDGTLWLGTINRGLFKSEGTASEDELTLTPVRQKGIRDLSIYSVVPVSSSGVWLATNHGILNISTDLEEAREFSTLDGLPSTDFNHGASVVTSEGRLLFGSPNGYISFDPLQAQRKFNSVRVFLRSVKIGEHPWFHTTLTKLPSSVVLPGNMPRLSVAVGVGELRDRLAVAYRYRLDGFSKHWRYSGNQNEITYTNLPPGDYLFRAQGADSSGAWSDNEVRLQITVLPPWWKTWPAYALYALVAVCLLILFKHANETRTLRKARDDLELEVSLSQEREVDELQAHLESTADLLERAEARTFDMLDCIDEFVATERVGPHNNLDDGFGLQARKRLDAIRMLQGCVSMQHGEPAANLHAYTDKLINTFVMEKESYSDIITVNNVPDKHTPTEHAVYIAVIIRELVENAFTHAFPHRPNGAIISVLVEDNWTDEIGSLLYTITIDDNGIGVPGSIERTPPTSGGLGLVSRIAQRLDGAVETNDVAGTRAIVSLRFLGTYD